jgi:hypothetical protein
VKAKKIVHEVEEVVSSEVVSPALLLVATRV